MAKPRGRPPIFSGSRYHASPIDGGPLEKEPAHLVPARDAPVPPLLPVVGSAEEDGGPPEALEVPGCVVDEDVHVEDALVAAEDEVARGDEGKVLAQPAVLRREGGGHLHGRRGDEHLVALGQLPDDLTASVDEAQVLE